MGIRKLVVLVSARGTNFVAIAKACRSGEIPNTEITSVITPNPVAEALKHAEAMQIPSVIIEESDRAEYNKKLQAKLEHYQPDFVCLAGYMRLLPNFIVDSWPNRIINIHPSLLPSFPGLHAQRQALIKGVAWTGCTVHFVNRELDSGPIIAQTPCEVRSQDTEETLSQRLLEIEHKTYVEAVKKLVSEPYKIVEDRVRWFK
jgi:phosphoribosylglycinamide formyltransferase 1